MGGLSWAASVLHQDRGQEGLLEQTGLCVRGQDALMEVMFSQQSVASFTCSCGRGRWLEREETEFVGRGNTGAVSELRTFRGN